MRFLLGFVLGILLLPLAIYAYLQFGNVPVAVADEPLVLERSMSHRVLDARINREAPKSSPIEPSPTNLLIGAQLYRDNCSGCHGYYGQSSPFGKHLFPEAPQLWAPHRNGVVGVSDDPVGETYWKVRNGIRLSGMPAFNNLLNETQMWQVSVLLANADKPLPATVVSTIKPGAPPAP
ncbi:MAG: c-type cytochrome [Acidobacteriaceae bacterium]